MGIPPLLPSSFPTFSLSAPCRRHSSFDSPFPPPCCYHFAAPISSGPLPTQPPFLHLRQQQLQPSVQATSAATMHHRPPSPLPACTMHHSSPRAPPRPTVTPSHHHLHYSQISRATGHPSAVSTAAPTMPSLFLISLPPVDILTGLSPLHQVVRTATSGDYHPTCHNQSRN
ncbi:hypothetical protein CK203_005633 [Vitis vinifera]|uniref:Uncharacterized protein n=1 Tax=Vitis vinifera TaxID=29760 RepID=A0A438K4D1_VITVI|nr:hypothetical protein CK203_005633 [Vitis vinifera]